jgi:hypothetical protein
MNPEALQAAHRMIDMRLSTHHPGSPTWTEYARALGGRHAVVGTYAEWGDRPSSSSAVALAADAVALLVAVIESEDMDISSGEAA